jgi:hypothetical protein
MRVPRVRFTVRRMMVAVAVIAIATTLGINLYRRSQRFRRIAAEFVIKEDMATEWNPPGTTLVRNAPPGEIGLEAKPRNAAYYTLMRMKYERYARRPWLLTTPDPPEPD